MDNRRVTNVYLSGPMTGKPDFNYNAFQIMADAIRQRCPHAHVVHTANAPRGRDHASYMNWALDFLRHCDVMVVIGDHRAEDESVGVRQEVDLAWELGIPVYYTMLDDIYEGGERWMMLRGTICNVRHELI